MLKAQLRVRNDPAGSGHFGALRGSRRHRGIDFILRPRDGLCSPVAGAVTKLGYAYPEDLSYRYVEVTDADGLRHRFFYVYPDVDEDDIVEEGTVLGCAQNIADKYPDTEMENHVHYEIIDTEGTYLDPEAVYGVTV